jgi:5'-nucleotidase
MKPLILVTNDDGITSKGISVLIEVMSKIGEVFVVAPDSPNSGMGHAITVDSTIHTKKSKLFKGADRRPIEAYECSGTPADCVKLAKHHFLKDRKIDLVVSGINHGMNASISVIYSGTMSAAVEGAIEGIPSIGFSLDDFKYDAEFSHVKRWMKRITEKALANPFPANVALNVNFPAFSDNSIKGIKICRQANGYWHEEFDARNDPHGRPYFWMGGDFVNHEPDAEDSDMWALKNNFIAIVPIHYDMTAHKTIKDLKKWKL